MKLCIGPSHLRYVGIVLLAGLSECAQPTILLQGFWPYVRVPKNLLSLHDKRFIDYHKETIKRCTSRPCTMGVQLFIQIDHRAFEPNVLVSRSLVHWYDKCFTGYCENDVAHPQTMCHMVSAFANSTILMKGFEPYVIM